MVSLNFFILGTGIKYQEITVEVDNSVIPREKKPLGGSLYYIYIYTLYSTRVQAEIFQSFEEEEVISDKKTLSVI